MVKRIFSINFFDSFIFGITTVVVPLLMLERGIDIATIGLVFALAPIAKMLVRLSSAALAEIHGERAFYSLNAAANFAQAAAYWFAGSALGFGLGKAIDGARESFIWAVNRTSIISMRPDRQHYLLGGLVSGRAIYFALGSLAVGLLFPFGGFSLLLLLMGALGIAAFALSFGVKNTPHHERKAVKLSSLAMLGREKLFYETAGAITFGSTFYNAIIYFLAPLLFKLNGFSLEQIGIFYAAYFLIFGVVLNLLSYRKAGSRWIASVGSVIFVSALIGMSFAGKEWLPWLFLFMAIGDAHLALIWEQILYLQVKGSKTRSTDVALLHAPAAIALFAVSCISGFVVEAFGFAPILLAGALTLFIFGAWSFRLTKIMR
jgi:MFS family permease